MNCLDLNDQWHQYAGIGGWNDPGELLVERTFALDVLYVIGSNLRAELLACTAINRLVGSRKRTPDFGRIAFPFHDVVSYQSTITLGQ
jgi:hypothetical protein